MRFDITTKYLIEHHAADWVALSGRTHSGRVEVVEAELSTVTASADRVLLVHDPAPWVLHLEPQASRDPELPGRILLYNVLLERKFSLPVWTVLVLLRPEADAVGLTGEVSRTIANGEEPYLRFRHRVVRLWQVDPAMLLGGGLGLLPLAPLSSVNQPDLPAVIARMRQRIGAESIPGEAAELWTATQILLGLRYSAPLVAQILQGVTEMEESTTYQAILEKGRVRGVTQGVAQGVAQGTAQGALQEARRLLLRYGQIRLGPPTEEVRAALETIKDTARIERMHDRVLQVPTWAELLDTP
jgi:predicted transposase YdaD